MKQQTYRQRLALRVWAAQPARLAAVYPAQTAATRACVARIVERQREALFVVPLAYVIARD